MPWHERDYYRDETMSPMRARLTGLSVTLWLLIINVAVFLIDALATGSLRGDWFSPYRWGNFNIADALGRLELWRFVTYQFLHGGILHIVFNMLALFWFGPMIEQWWGSRRFLAFYLLCGVGGAVTFTILALVPGVLGQWAHAVHLVGASGSVLGILVACAVVAPHQRVMLLFPPIPMSLRTMALVFLGLAVVSVVLGSAGAGGDAAHLGGAGVGFLLIKQPWLLGWVNHLRLPRLRRWQRFRQKVQRRRVQNQQARVEAEDAEVDRILDKVKQHGLHSLSNREKRTLQRATERQRRTG